MITTIYLLRHGETEGNGVHRYKGSIDVPLSEKGIQQVKRSSAFIREHLEKMSSAKYLTYLKDIHSSSEAGSSASRTSPRLKAVYCSNLGRAVRSAEIIAEPYGLRSVEVPDFRERHFGIWEGMTFQEIKEKFPEEFASWADYPLEHSPSGGETTIEVKSRIIPPLNRILSDHKGENIAVVAPSGSSRTMPL